MDDFQLEADLSREVLKEVSDQVDSQLAGRDGLPDLGARYETLELIGEGGMGSVYKVRDTELDTILAIKVMKPELSSDKTAKRRFEQEVESISRLSHVNVVSIYDYSTTSDGSPFLVMDFVEGESLDKFLRREGKLAPEVALSIVSQICEALTEAHELGIIHRDLKPSNIILQRSQGEDWVAKIVDFGIAKVATEDSEAASLTQTGVVIGSPLYASPEQCQGNPHDERSDIYSLGCILYELLTNTRPFDAPNTVKIILNQISKTADPISANALAGQPERVEEFNLVISRCLAKDPEERYQTVSGLLLDVHTLRSGRRIKRESVPRRWSRQLLQVPPEPRSIISIFLWWEYRRLPYNVIIGLCGLFSLLFSFSAGMIPGYVSLGYIFGGIFFYGFMANVCYTLGFIAELISRYFLKKKAENIGPLLLFLGVLFSVILTLSIGLGTII